MTPGSPSRRGRGERAGLDRAAILDAARTLPSEQLTMQGVADALGVDRKALHHYVHGREGLLELLAEDVFLTRIAALEIPSDAPWPQACRTFAEGIRQSLVASGALVEHFRTLSRATLAAVRPAEVVLERLLDGGLDEVAAGRTLLLLTTVATGFAREEVAAAGAGGHPQVAQFRGMLRETGATDLSVLRRLDESGFDAYGDAQFAFDVDAVIATVEVRLAEAEVRLGD
ncbi:TetR/AcrR family transcriptional regulator [Microbacterium sp. RG1]|uniref:TetR/AcrR family transcriptional regulator n=1 Tax=Microbacterium sp. RG1 TaxID=2489212 RepID=UPI0010CA57FD|nr:TetR/AcrR family transcriptional regulator C-terminal domain-containing protein [Microbacterium sp. RG1]QCQ16855.1 TetR/AcrR family transcriptional regulator [Microbacterium sp. RG1]